MTCEEVEARGLAEEYLAGRLPADERDAFERHYFECDRCYGELETLQAIRGALTSVPAPAPRASRLPRTWLPVAAAVMIAATAAAWWIAGRGRHEASPPARSARTESPSSAPAPSPGRADARVQAIQQLARFEPPRVPSRLRNTTGGAFHDGLEEYRAGNFARALPLFQRALREDHRSDQIRFYLGVSALMAMEPNAALTPLKQLAEDRNSAYAEEAQFLLARAHLQREDLRAALEAVDATIAMGGERADEARGLREAIQKLQ